MVHDLHSIGVDSTADFGHCADSDDSHEEKEAEESSC